MSYRNATVRTPFGILILFLGALDARMLQPSGARLVEREGTRLRFAKHATSANQDGNVTMGDDTPSHGEESGMPWPVLGVAGFP
ncbi:hypothetical protein GQ53DRAFT_747310 [Thozetella sp. PMI_491]|nr:hypothetical protein GQ53DRAFT_747310 [Thozetella sp. PMI_491]